MSEKETPTPREELTAAKRMNEESTAAKSTTPSRQEEPTTVKTTPPPPKPAEESTAVKRALLFMYWVAALLGSDYVFTLSSGPNYFTRIDTGGAFDMRDSEPTKAANTQFSNAWTVWAAGQFVGSVLSKALSGALGWRPALFLYVVLMLAGNLMYVLADPSVAGSIRLVIAGKFVDGLGCGATALGIGYAGYLTLAGASTVFSMGLSPAYKGILPKTAFATMMSAYKASVDVGKIPGPRWSNFVQQHLDNEYIAYVPLIVAFSLIAAFVVAGRPFLTRPYAATTKVGAAESC